MVNKIDKNSIRQFRHKRMRNNLSGTQERPRLNVYRSTCHIYAQLINDVSGKTIVASSTLEKTLQKKLEGKTKVEQAKIVGESVAKKALAKGVKEVVFDRGGYIYMGRVQSLADGAREAGLKF